MTADHSGRNEQAEAVGRAIADLRNAVNMGDAATIYQITADDFEMMPPGQAALSGSSAREFLCGIVTQFKADLEPFSNEQVVVCGEWAFQRYTYQLKLTPKAGGNSTTQRGDGIHIFHRDTAGSWRLAKDIFTSVAETPASV